MQFLSSSYNNEHVSSKIVGKFPHEYNPFRTCDTEGLTFFLAPDGPDFIAGDAIRYQIDPVTRVLTSPFVAGRASPELRQTKRQT
ncbi:hypothetical protein RHMOL_Rhmol11G0213800 [Rhododendron molle]|uniref:Uncharacterized protein n=1 Tax=Rhododendron molle TaxID=49168 RepID=A0ACC0LW98_RHOML|nr:hypothetical protein RHMOL_Rhmol11G0213800 [Rhododendron molle]